MKKKGKGAEASPTRCERRLDGEEERGDAEKLTGKGRKKKVPIFFFYSFTRTS